MTRREFGVAALGSVLAAQARGLAAAQPAAALRVNGQRLNDHLTALSAFGRNPQGGVSRVAYSDADKAGRAAVMDWMRAASLDPSIDAAGNIVGRRAGSAALKPLVFGSHIDSVPEGGNYDGDVGSLGAIEVAQTLAERSVTLRHPIEVTIWSNEEGGLYGSRAWSGQLEGSELANVSSSGKTIADGIRFIGGDPSQLGRVKRAKGDIAGYFELHIEQGGILDAAGTNIGIVEGIVGIQQWDVTVTGFANHAGTTPMDQRHDALLSAARFIDMVNRVVRSVPGRQVGTVGRIQALPGAPNVIPGEVRCTLELRDLDDAKVAQLYSTIRDEATKIGAENQTTFAFRSLHVNVSAPSDPKMRAIISDAARSLGLSTRVMPSGAGHDAQAIAQLGPMGMIFIPSVGGISHSPKEFSRPEDIVNGANVLLAAVVAADRTL
ncbi:MAG TPA: Zn-dependent hydrolase [Vicinamibacterales bacterium]|nr:Zn-dependent hydrolase [Vicinamibacterales bacterium]